MNIDEKNYEILKLLLKDARMPFSEIGKRAGLSRTAVAARVKAMEESGIISGYRAVIKDFCENESVSFIMNIETEAKHFEEAKRYFSESRETLTLIQTTGNCHLVAVCRAASIKEMRVFANNAYKLIDGILSINIHQVIETVKGSILPDSFIAEVHDDKAGTNSNNHF